jgi:AcrR family transcriptional regulator
MATASSQPSRVARRRAAVRDEALDHAVDVMTEEGVGALTVSEVARRMGIRGPSLYKYFPSRFAMYDALFARGLAAEAEALRRALENVAPGVDQIRIGGAAIVRWAVENPALAQLLHWRPVPGFAPSAETFAGSEQGTAAARAVFATAVRLGQLRPEADTEEVLRLWTVVLSGLMSQQMANEPGVPYGDGRFSGLTDAAIEMFLSTYRP